MGIRSIDGYLRERKLVQTAPLSALANARLGIDATHYLRTLLSEPDSREPLVASTGGLPLALSSRIEQDLRVLDKHSIKPVFVFAGLPLAGRPPPRGDPQRERLIQNEAWSHYENGDVEKAVLTLAAVRGGAWTDHRDVLRLVLRLFRHRYVEFVIAPHLEFAQLAYLLSQDYIHAIYSSSEALLWSIDKLITTLDLTGSFSFVEKSRLLTELAMTDEQFLDMSILAGSSLSRTFPPAASDFSLKTVIDLVRQHKSGMGVLQRWRESPSHAETFLRARLAVKYSLVLTTQGTCQPLPLVMQPPQITAADVPSDLDEIFSMRFPDEVYFFICRSFVSPQVVGWLSSGIMPEPQPFADSLEYRRFVKDVLTEGHTSPKCTTLALLAAGLHERWKQRRVIAHYYFDPYHSGTQIPFADPLAQSLVEKCGTWSITTTMLETELRRQNSSTIDIKLCIAALASEELAAKTVRRDGKQGLEKKDEAVANIVWRFLDVRGFIHPNHTQTTIGKALHAACASSRVNDRFQEALYILLELLRAGVVHGLRFGGPDAPVLSGGPSYGTDEEQRCCLLVMRCLSILPLTFRTDVNTGFGILAKTYIDAATFHLGEQITETNANTDAARQAKRDALAFVEESFSSVKSPIQEVERGFRFWDSEQRPGSSGSIPVVSDAVAAEFEAADKWLRPMRP
ncbi:hypothetical protein EHS25_008821 [Saitozyma podzolica]|uniref:XPG N-terminal domain-containing protein n=1 Tax=Saitozyma podzolica TaxID=1890683 RepID=A0A427YMV9_9TREE|nr:hypothetical protein EHS25_008821 [Saitozyma podzolica]